MLTRQLWTRSLIFGGAFALAGCAGIDKSAPLPPASSAPAMMGQSGGRGAASAAPHLAYKPTDRRASDRLSVDDETYDPDVLPVSAEMVVSDPSAQLLPTIVVGDDSAVTLDDAGMMMEGDGFVHEGLIHDGKLPRKVERQTFKALGIANLHKKRKSRRDIGMNPNVPRELRMASHPLYVVEPPDVLYIEAYDVLPNQDISGERLIRQDGTISLGYYGQIHVSGLTLEEIEEKLRQHLQEFTKDPKVYVDVAAFNSKVYYVLGQVQQRGRLPITGKETVLDAITLAGGLTNFADTRRVYMSRPNPGGGCDQIFYVDYKAILCGDTRTNYQLVPGDRVVVPATGGYNVSVFFDNFLTPVERLTSLFALVRFASSSGN